MTTKSERALEDWRAGECDLRTALEAIAADDEVGTNLRLAVGAALEQGLAKGAKFKRGQRVIVKPRSVVRSIVEVKIEDGVAVYRIPFPSGMQWYSERQLEWAAPTLTVDELIDELSKYKGTRYVIGFTNTTDYVNVAGLSSPDDADDALVIEFSEDYDSRQW